MAWGNQQEDALVAVREWLTSKDRQVFRLFGYAGTGKTTLAKHFAEGIEGLVLFGAYTGKAAHVLKTKGCPAQTIHSLIYQSKDKGASALRELELQLQQALAEMDHLDREDKAAGFEPAHIRVLREGIEAERKSIQRPLFKLKEDSIVRGAKLLVIDECSMVDGQMGEDLLSFDTPILVLGDPAQLPPVFGAGFFTEGVKPDVMLTEIHRQAADNPILAMATKVRGGEPLALGNYGESSVVERSSPEEAMATDQVLVGRNATRFASNRRMRELLGRTEPLPEVSDKLVCLRNSNERGLLNGAIWHVTANGAIDDEKCYLEVRSEESDAELACEAHTHHFLGKGDQLPWWDKKQAEEFDYGYALTVHKSQGSQWNDVILFDESWCFRADRWRWLYTGITRAAERITVVRM